MGIKLSTEFSEKTAKLTIDGDVDTATAPMFMKEIEKITINKPLKLVIFAEGLKFMSSAGLRVIIFAKQKLGAEASIFLVNPQEQIVDTLKKTGFHLSVHIVDSYTD
jgi:anti-anti-sigma factor